MDCTACGLDLRDSQSEQTTTPSDSQMWKSCPRCSERDGIHVFYLYDDFGFRDMGAKVRVQSWCGPCRSKQPPDPPAFVCSD